MTPVTDPGILDQLNGSPAGLKPVTDPSVLSQLNGNEKQPGWLERMADVVTGHLRTEYPDAPEFLPAVAKAGNQTVAEAQAGKAPAFDPSAINRSAITSDPKVALEILSKHIPGLESKKDKFGNLMLKAPGMSDFAYLNKPGISGRDLDELGTQVLATLPLLGPAGAGATLPARIASGAGFGGLSELARQGMEKAAGRTSEGDDASLALNTLFGGMFAPGVVSATAEKARDIVSPIGNVFRSAVNPEQEAARRVATSFEHTVTGGGSKLTPEQAANAAADMIKERPAVTGSTATIGGDVRLMDVMGERGRALARSASNVSPEARQTIQNVVQPRFETQGARTADFLERIGGGDLAGQSRAALEDMAYKARAPFYNKTFKEGAGGLFSPELADIAKAPVVREAMNAAHDELLNKKAGGRLVTDALGPNGNPTLEYWDQVKRLLNDKFTTLSKGGKTSQAANVAAITDRLVSHLDTLVPSYKEARGVSMGIFRANNALDAGENFVTSKLKNSQAEAALAEMSKQERELFKQGFVSRYIEHLNETGDRRNILNLITTSPAARERLDIALGPKGARELEAHLRIEGLMDASRTATSGNSTTARQLMELGLAGGTGALVSGFDPTNPAGWIAAVLTKHGIHKFGDKVDTRVANHIAEMITSRDPAIMAQGLQTVAHSKWLDVLRSVDQAIGRTPRALAAQEVSR